MTEAIQQSGIISDANVLIDYAKSAPHILKLVNVHVQKLYVVPSVLKEVDQLNQSDAEKLGIEVIEPSLAQIIEIAGLRQKTPAISEQDAMCFIIARDMNWACFTNDKLLRGFVAKIILVVYGDLR